MIDYAQIRDRLFQQWSSGITQAELAKRYGINQQNIAKVLSGEIAGKKVNLDFLNRLFPYCNLGLEEEARARGHQGETPAPDNASVHGVMQIGTTNQAAIGGNFTIHQGVEVDKAFRQKVYDLAIKHSDKKGFVLLAPFLKELQELE